MSSRLSSQRGSMEKSVVLGKEHDSAFQGWESASMLDTGYMLDIGYMLDTGAEPHYASVPLQSKKGTAESFQAFCLKDGSKQGQKLALTVVCVRDSLDCGIRESGLTTGAPHS